MAAAKAKPMFDEAAKVRMSEGGKHGVAFMPPLKDTGKSRDEAAKAFNVSPRSVENAVTVLKNGIPELTDAVDLGEIAVTTAATIARAEPEIQEKIISLPPQKRQKAAKKLANGGLFSPEFSKKFEEKLEWQFNFEEALEALSSMPVIRAEIQESEEMRRLLYVSLTRPRDLLILAGQDGKLSGEWSDTLGAEWMWPEGTSLSLPNGQTLRTMVSNFENIEHEPKHPAYKTSWLEYPQNMPERQRRYTSPSSIEPLENARIGETIILGDRLPVQDKYDTTIMGSALHAVIAAKISGSEATQRILEDHGMDKAITVDTANQSAERLLALIQSRFSPIQVFSEHPISYISSSGQVVNGWIDMLIETQEGYILIDHKASPRARGHWPEIALSYSGQLKAYADGIRKTSDKHVLSTWIHFALTGGLVGVL